MGRIATPSLDQSQQLQKAIKRQNEARSRLASAASDEEVQRWAGEYVASTDDAYEIAKDVPRGYACSR